MPAGVGGDPVCVDEGVHKIRRAAVTGSAAVAIYDRLWGQQQRVRVIRGDLEPVCERAGA